MGEDASILESWFASTGADAALLERAGLDPRDVAEGISEICQVCHKAWQSGIMNGYNGNMSLKLGSGHMLVTAAGSAKASIGAGDISLATIPDGKLLAGKPLSSETPMHLAVYATRKKTAKCILHTHPAGLLALSLHFREFPGKMFDIPLYEAKMWKERLSFAQSCAPGSQELAEAVGRASKIAPAVCMIEHGLCVAGSSPADALAVSEQFEHLAQIQIYVLRIGII